MRSRSANVNARRPGAGRRTHTRYGHGVLRAVYRGERVGGKDAGDVPEEAVKQRRRGRTQPKGRQVEPEALADVRELLGDAPRDREFLIEYLHLVQERFGHLAARHLAALAQEMRLAMAEVWEVATFYAHLDTVKEDGEEPPALTLRVCDSLSCELAGAPALLESLRAAFPEARVAPRDPLRGGRGRAGHRMWRRDARNVPRRRRAAGWAAAPIGEYEQFRACLDGSRTREEVAREIEEAGLRGMGGAGFPSARKWGFVRAGPKPRHLAVNADEGEPGTFKDRYFLETAPGAVLEGALIAAWAVEADTITIYLRDEYPDAREIMAAEIDRLGELAPAGGVHLRRGAGAYICGEESAMLESIEGKRGLPRHRPPYVAQVGLHGRPTLVHNVETLYWMPAILERGAAWFAETGRHGGKGWRAYSVSGRVKQPGVKIVPAGVTARELIEEFSGGMADGRTFKAYLPGGASGGILPASLADVPLDFGKLEPHGCFTGSGAVVVLAEGDDIGAAALNLMRFFAYESCGQCTPCRVGTEKAALLMAEPAWDRDVLEDLATVMADASICGLGQAAPNPLRCAMKYFPEDVGL